MALGEAIKSLLSGVTDEVYPNRADQELSLPYIVYNFIDTQPSDTKSGDNLDVIRLQFDIYASTYALTDALANSVRAALDRYSGTQNSVQIDKIVFEDQRDAFDNDAKKQGILQDYFIRVKR